MTTSLFMRVFAGNLTHRCRIVVHTNLARKLFLLVFTLIAMIRSSGDQTVHWDAVCREE